MANVIQGRPRGEGRRVAVVCARFNELITRELLRGCVDELERHGVDPDAIQVVWVPGAWEIPMIARKAAKSRRFDGVICLGAVIRGSTPHFDYVANEVSKGVAEIPRETGIPAIFGVITTDTIEQAVERAGTKAGNKGFDAAQGAVEMVNLLKEANSLFDALPERQP